MVWDADKSSGDVISSSDWDAMVSDQKNPGHNVIPSSSGNFDLGSSTNLFRTVYTETLSLGGNDTHLSRGAANQLDVHDTLNMGGVDVPHSIIGQKANYRFIEDWAESAVPADWVLTGAGTPSTSFPTLDTSVRERSIEIKTSTTAGNDSFLSTPELILGSDDFTLEFRLRGSADINREFEAGLVDAVPTTIAWTNTLEKASFRKTSANWVVATSDGTTENTTDTGVAVGSTNHILRIERIGSSIEFFINDVLEATHTTNLPGDDGLRVVLSVETLNTFVQSIIVGGAYVEKIR